MGKLTAAILLSVVAAEHRREKPRVCKDGVLLAHLAGNSHALVTGNILPCAPACIYHGEDYSDANENDASNPDDDQHRRPEPERSVASAHLLLLPYTVFSTPNEALPSAGGRRASGETDAGEISRPHRKSSTPRERTGV